MEKNVKREDGSRSRGSSRSCRRGRRDRRDAAPPKQESQAVLNDAANQLGVTPSELSPRSRAHWRSGSTQPSPRADHEGPGRRDEAANRVGRVPALRRMGPAAGGGLEHHEMLGRPRRRRELPRAQRGRSCTAAREAESPSQMSPRPRASPWTGSSQALVADVKTHLDEEVSEGHITKAQETGCSPASSRGSARWSTARPLSEI